jgi:hypothetical protein
MKKTLVVIITVLTLFLTSCNFLIPKNSSNNNNNNNNTNNTNTKGTTVSVQDDLIDYINNGLSPIASLEQQAIDAYQSVSGENYKDDQTMYDAMTKTVIPNYEEFQKKLEALSPQTKEVQDLHAIYINGVNSQMEGFKMVIEALEKSDASIIEQANVKLQAGKAGIDNFKSTMDSMAKQYDVTIK